MMKSMTEDRLADLRLALNPRYWEPAHQVGLGIAAFLGLLAGFLLARAFVEPIGSWNSGLWWTYMLGVHRTWYWRSSGYGPSPDALSQWRPRMPERLDEEELADWRATVDEDGHYSFAVPL
jgi:hypothetical protein